jgi:putative hemolysin
MHTRERPLTLAAVLLGYRATPDLSRAHIVDQMIAERAQRLTSHITWPILRPVAYRALHYRRAVSMADDIAALPGAEAMEYLSRLLALELDIVGIDRLPRSGGFILAPSHPTGIADGIAVFDFLKTIRPDMAIFANRDALRVAPGFRDLIIPVEWRAGQKTHSKSRDTLEATARAFSSGKVVVLFPSGRIAYWTKDGLTERPWQTSIVALARRYDVPVVPLNIQSRNSGLFYLLSRFSTELRDMTVFHELLNKTGAGFRMTVGTPIAPSSLEGDAGEVATKLQAHTVTALAADPDARFD